MTDQQGDDEKQAAVIDVVMGFDGFGEPLLMLQADVPEGGVQLSAEQITNMGLHMIQSAARARGNADVARQMMIDGVPIDAVMEFLATVMGGPSGRGNPATR